MKPQIQNQSEKKQKQIKPQQNKQEEKQKDKKLVSSSSTNDKTNIQPQSNLKSKKNSSLTDSTKAAPSKKNEQNQKNISEASNPKSDRRVFSVSQEKNRNNNKNNSSKKNRKKPRNLSMEKNLNSSQEASNNLKVANQIPKKTNKNKKPKKEEETIKIEDPLLFQNYDPNLYGFNLYKHIKENLRNKDKLCKDKLTKDTLYCIDCKLSTCKKCLLFHNHDGHTLIPKYLYYEPDQKVFNDTFNEIDSLLLENPVYINNQKLKEELKNIVNDSINKLTKRLNDVKNKKFKQLDKLFESTDGCLDALKEKKDKIKEDIKKYLDKQKDFYFINVKDENEEDGNDKELHNEADIDVLKNLKQNVNNKAGMIESNNDTYNSTFLISYDLFKNTLYINSQICKLLNDINDNKEKYLNELNENINKINEDIDKLSKPFNGIFNYNYLTNEFYKMISDKLNKYSEKIDAMRRYIFDMVNKDRGFDTIEKDNIIAETGIKQRFDNILNYQLSDKDEALTVKSGKGKNNNLHRLSMYLNAGVAATRLRNTLNSLSNGTNGSTGTKKDDKKLHTIYESPDEIKLDKGILQKYFAYEAYNTIHNHFRYKKPKSDEDLAENLDDEIDIARPIPGTNEMFLYDKKTTSLTKKEVSFDKKKHKYLQFLNGCRSVLVKDMLYILGGVDQEKQPTKIAYVYYIQTNELKIMPEMLKPHAYHSVEFLDYYKSIIVVGGENSCACEIYDMNTGLWRDLPDMNIPRAHCNLYLDKYANIFYAFFGAVGDITEKNNYTDVIECMELKRLALGWSVIDYQNKAEMDFKSGYTKILSLSPEMVLIYGATNMRDFVKKAAVYLIPKFEIVKIDNKIFKEIKEKSKYSRKLSKILSSYI